MEKLSFNDFKRIIENINIALQENKTFLSELDSVIGDGDHGISIAKGFTYAIAEIEKQNPQNISDLLKLAGNSITLIIGGVTGPVFGMFFSKMGEKITSEDSEVDIKILFTMFENALNKIMELGGAKPGDKTMIDALNPAVQSLKFAAENELTLKKLFLNMMNASKIGAESTSEMIATKGRARYSGERSLGHEDAGANTVYFIIKAFYESI
ncbi:MAG: dihydroxyacetone kinase subunit DhaL [Actinobacteria bacterium]|nr:dihydroxyacetone kinase subunit DhaL [Actinomycetota bacterium]